uniref:Uncharacterized protein ycf18 n=1 Tax=Corynoplastis japonica TaxID=700918 RepID=A0A1X9PTR6_9RHOD|nr:phycobilisome degradation protein [Corynoplastis japonica]
MNLSNNLSLEQKFKLTIYTNYINKLNTEQTSQYLIQLLRKMLIKDNIIRYIINKHPPQL